MELVDAKGKYYNDIYISNIYFKEKGGSIDFPEFLALLTYKQTRESPDEIIGEL